VGVERGASTEAWLTWLTQRTAPSASEIAATAVSSASARPWIGSFAPMLTARRYASPAVGSSATLAPVKKLPLTGSSALEGTLQRGAPLVRLIEASTASPDPATMSARRASSKPCAVAPAHAFRGSAVVSSGAHPWTSVTAHADWLRRIIAVPLSVGTTPRFE